MKGEDPLLLLPRAARERKSCGDAFDVSQPRISETAQAATFQLRHVRSRRATRAEAIEIFAASSARMRVLRDDIGDPKSLKTWIAVNIQRLLDAPQ